MAAPAGKSVVPTDENAGPARRETRWSASGGSSVMAAARERARPERRARDAGHQRPELQPARQPSRESFEF